MQLNQVKFEQVVKEAKAKAAGNRRWLNAIDKAVEGLNGGWIVTELADCLLITTESGETYRANGVCQCKAHALGQPCKHRAAAQLWKRYNEALSAPAPRDERAELIAGIKTTWSRRFPHDHLADALMARFGRNTLTGLDTGTLRRVLAAIQ